MLSNCVLKIVIGFCNLKKKNTLIHKIAQLLIIQPGLEKKNDFIILSQRGPREYHSIRIITSEENVSQKLPNVSSWRKRNHW